MKFQHYLTIIMLSSILKLFGCASPKNTRNTVTGQDTLNEKINQSIEEFNNRPIHTKMTVEIIDTTSDDRLLQSVYDNLCEKLPEDNSKELSTVENFPKCKQAIYVIWQLEAEVNNGGFSQFYYNSSGQFAHLIPEALNMVEAHKFSELVHRANSIYQRDHDRITKYQDGTIEGASKSYDDNALNDLDEEFLKLYKAEDLYKLQVDFIRKNKQEFIN